MNKIQKFFSVFSTGNMEFYWIYSIIAFISFLFNDKAFPLAMSFLVFWLASGISILIKNSRMYVFVMILFYGIGYLLSLSWIVNTLYNNPNKFSDIGLIISLFTTSKSSQETTIFIGILLGVTIIWVRGALLGRKKIDYKYVISRFEIGVVAFFFIGFLEAVSKITPPNMSLYIIIFFLWSIVAIALGKNISWSNESNNGRSSKKTLLFFVLAVFILIMSTITFFMDPLTWIAETGFSATKTILNPLKPFFIALIRFLFSGYTSSGKGQTASGTGGEGIGNVNGTIEESWFSHILGNAFMICMYVLVTIVILIILASIIKVLFKKKGEDTENKSLIELLYELVKYILTALKKIIYIIKTTLTMSLKNESEVVKIYKKLIKWGTIRGIYYQCTETPFEYINRLSIKYPHYNAEFNLIAKEFCREVYGNSTLSYEEITNLKKSLRKVISKFSIKN
ncbi:hypothetical protein SH2C18_26570 [Clostridium sediminicola]|uniref:hypothetical protein n=1 Tax=Clostridium sediminicola TaxID=3114879 RepID=UPI0031F20272